ncbi:DUF5677 domain-containing protein [Arthrobacter sp. E44]|uniref:DUF5677 domain-containing protein n=1 Tax=Arthrobacter sp. E44 TaxID=3341794 RepID=UPI0035A73287
MATKVAGALVERKQDSRAILLDALAVYKASDLTQIRIRASAGSDIASEVAYSWFKHMLRTSEAIVTLADAGFDAEIAPLRRSLMEHCTAMFWLTRSPEKAVNSLFKAYQQTLKKIEMATAGKWDINYDLLRTMAEAEMPPNDENNLLSFKALTDAEEAQATYAAWLQETAFSHAGWSTGRLYVKHDGTRLQLPDSDVRDSYRVTAMYLLFAADRLIDFWENPPILLQQSHAALITRLFPGH